MATPVTELPQGFTLDAGPQATPQTELPAGFTVDAAPASAQPLADMAGNPPSFWDKITAPIREGQVGRALGLDTITEAAKKRDPSLQDDRLLRVDEALPANDQGIMHGAAQFASGLTTPENAAIMLGTSGLGAFEGMLGKAGLSKLASLGFSAQMIADGIASGPQFAKQVQAKDWAGARETMTKVALSAYLAKQGVQHAMTPEAPPSSFPAPEREYSSTGQEIGAQPAGSELPAGFKLDPIPATPGPGIKTPAPAPQLPSELLPQPDEVDQATTQAAQQFVTAATAPPPEPVAPEPQLQLAIPPIQQETPDAVTVEQPGQGARQEVQQEKTAAGPTIERPVSQPQQSQPTPAVDADAQGPVLVDPELQKLREDIALSPDLMGKGKLIAYAKLPPEVQAKVDRLAAGMMKPSAPETRAAQVRNGTAPAIAAPEPEPATGPAYGKPVNVAVPGEETSYPARYGIRELADVQPSHNGMTFEANPRYEYQNDRDYKNNPEISSLVADRSGPKFDPNYAASESPTAEHGGPVIDTRGNVLGGNSRSMTLGRVYESNPAAVEKYKTALRDRAASYGLTPEDIDRFKQPVMVRELSEQPNEAGAQRAITDFNKKGAAALAPAERAIADGRLLSRETVQSISAKLENVGEGSTLAQAMQGDNGAQIVDALVKDGVITQQERGGLVDERGLLTGEAKDRIAKMLVGRMFESPAQFQATPPELRNKLERVAPQVLRLEGRAGWSITPQVQEGLALLADVRSHGGRSLDDYLNQPDLAGEQKDYSPEAVGIARTLNNGPLKAARAFRQFANDEAISREGAPSTFFEPPTRGEAFQAAFGDTHGEFAQDLSVPYDRSKPRPRDAVFGQARWEVTPARRGRPPILRLNRQALDAVSDAIGRSAGGAKLKPEGAGFFAERIRSLSEDLLSKGAVGMDTARNLYGLAGAFESAADPQSGLIYHLSDRSIPLWRRAQILREELTHTRQGETSRSPEKAAAVRTAVMAHPAFAAARAKLNEHGLYAGASDETAVREITAKIAAGVRGQVGMSLGEARDLIDTYYTALAKEFDVSTADRVLQYADRESRGTVTDARRRIESRDRVDDGGRGVSAEVQRRSPAGTGPVTGGLSSVERGRETGPDEVPPGAGGKGPAEFATDADRRGDDALKRFLGDETGSSKVGAIFKADIKDMRALIAKREAAAEALKKAKADPVGERAGNELAEYYLAERDLWATRVNQVIGRLRRMVADTVDQEALSILRDFTHRPKFELPAWLNGTHPVLKDLDKPKREAVTKKLELLRPSIERAMNPTPRMKAVNDVLTQIAEASGKEAEHRGMIPKGLDPQRYFSHLLNPKGEGEVAQSLGERIGKAMGGRLGKNYAFAAHRSYPTVLDAIADNVVPKTLNVFDAFTIHGDKFATSRATHLLLDRLHDSGMGIWDSMKGGDKLPEGWVKLAPHSTEFHNEIPITDSEGEPQVVNQALWVHPAVSKAMRPITDPDYMHVVRGFTGLRGWQALMKQAQLSMSMFHARALNIMALGNMGPTGWVKALRADRFSPTFERGERDMVIHGGTSPIQGKSVEAYQSLEPGSIPTWTEIWRRAPGLHQMDTAAKAISELTFNNLQRRFKVTDYMIHSSEWMADHPDASAEEVDTAKRSIAKEINAVYGGLNWERLGINHATLEVARAIMLAPDWTFSNLFNVKYAMEKGTPAGRLARAFWLRTVVGGLIATQLMSYLLSRKPSKKLTQVYAGKDKKGDDVYQNMFFAGAPQDATSVIDNIADYGAVVGLFRTMANKTAPGLHVAMDLAKMEDFMGRPIVQKGMHPIASTVRGGMYAARGVLPIPYSVQNMTDMLIGPEAKKYAAWEIPSTLISGNPPRHTAPSGRRMTKHGLVVTHPKPLRSIWEEIKTGKR